MLRTVMKGRVCDDLTLVALRTKTGAACSCCVSVCGADGDQSMQEEEEAQMRRTTGGDKEVLAKGGNGGAVTAASFHHSDNDHSRRVSEGVWCWHQWIENSSCGIDASLRGFLLPTIQTIPSHRT